MPAHTPSLPPSLFSAIERELDAHPDGLGEYQLLGALRAEGFFDFLPPPPATAAELFRAHFILFHALYRLAERLMSMGAAQLQIEPLCIRRLPWSPGEAALATGDPLRAYYLDWSNLESTSAADVDRLIASFWKRFAGLEGREGALAELGLQDPVDDATIKATWRRLAMEHHPDRGGDGVRLQAINAALDTLLGRPSER
ncbi:MAG TPA: molecular chaperone DnaJ [Gammaproteobacteria bacterium]|nr:molecular chaperone DnaJ [Gammaproteobacteria bacterium]